MFGSVRRLLCAAMVLAIAFAAPAGAADVDCSVLDLHVVTSLDYTKVRCRLVEPSAGDPYRKGEVIVANSKFAVHTAMHFESGENGLQTLMPVERMVDLMQVFARTWNWTSEWTQGAFTLRRFEAAFTRAPDLPFACIGYGRLLGPNSADGRPKHFLGGFYCAAAPEKITQARIGQVLGSMALTPK
jgi:hypothetical protein